MGSESTSNSMKFPPLRLAELMPKLMALKHSEQIIDISYSSGEESESTPCPSPRRNTGQRPTPNNIASNRSASCRADSCEKLHKKSTENKENNQFPNHPQFFTQRSKIAHQTKEANVSSSCTYPGRGCGDESCPAVVPHPASENKKRNLSVRNHAALQTAQSASKCTPECKRNCIQTAFKSKLSTPNVASTKIVTPVANGHKVSTPKFKSSTPKVKCSTPVLKQGIRKFTPSSSRSMKRSAKKESVKKTATPNKDSARCLFPEPQRKPADTPQSSSVLETPSNRSAQAVQSTPSYPNTNSSKITLKSIVIKGKSYMFIKKLGSGGSSDVFKVLEVGGECGEYAVKCVNMAVERNLAQGYINEIRLLRELQSSDRVIQLYAYEYDKSSLSLKVVLEVGETDLSSFLKARQATGLPPALVLYYWEEMLHAVDHIHQHGVVHADLKPANFLLVCGRLKLIDFGIASAISTDATSVERPCAAGTFSYISPEALMGGAGRYESTHTAANNAPIKISFKSDVWSLGCILYSMVYGYTPFGHMTNVYAKITAIVDPKQVINYRPVNNMPPNLMSAMKWCLTYNAKSRPSVKQLLSIEYLSPHRQSLPDQLLNKMQPHVTEEEFSLLQKARI